MLVKSFLNGSHDGVLTVNSETILKTKKDCISAFGHMLKYACHSNTIQASSTQTARSSMD